VLRLISLSLACVNNIERDAVDVRARTLRKLDAAFGGAGLQLIEDRATGAIGVLTKPQ
jgi:hypothetical protein